MRHPNTQVYYIRVYQSNDLYRLPCRTPEADFQPKLQRSEQYPAGTGITLLQLEGQADKLVVAGCDPVQVQSLDNIYFCPQQRIMGLLDILRLLVIADRQVIDPYHPYLFAHEVMRRFGGNIDIITGISPLIIDMR